MEFLLKASGLITTLFLFYIVFLKNDTFYKSIRHYFLLGLLCSLAIPFIEIPIYVEQAINNFNTTNIATTVNIVNSPEEESFNWLLITPIIYAIGVLFFSIKFIIQIVSLLYLIYKNEVSKQNNFYYVKTERDISPFSFFNYIVYNPTSYNQQELEQIINHEKVHVNQLHSLDTILTHLVVILLWFNPFAWLYKKIVLQNLEFLADKQAIQTSKNIELYQHTLLKTSGNTYYTALTNNFYNSLIKKRIMMLHKTPSKKLNQWKYALLIPVIIAFIATFNTKTVAQEKKLTEIENIDKLEVKLKLDKDTDSKTLKEEASFFKKEFDADISFKSIKRNKENEITSIKITSKYKSNSTVFVRKSDKPISPIIITYNSEIDKINIGDASNEDPESAYSKNKRIHEKHKKIHEKIKISNNLNTSKINSDTLIVENNKFIINKIDDNNIEVEVTETEDSDKKNTIKVTNTIFISDEGEETKIDLDKINASENTYIIESDDAKGHKIKTYTINNESSIINEKEKPKVFVNGKETSYENIEKISPDNIKSISVLKDDSAIKKYGEKAKNGVIEITTKENYRVLINTDEKEISTNLNRIADDNKPLVLVNGKEISTEEMKDLDPDTIKSMNVIKNVNATKKYGERGENGVIEITLKE
ncbi:hypothetical protein MKD41_07615 [Lutibacter sp. A64]|uniref:M56 family metallopeptidase n=1 Tax=Lutibacter sp. A64 TaxID=2918526 RepID=UPI001F0526EC|nr:M56 family metallopeptidase [Lutibacter sp. A64]UMB55329.1 hypothetical protein MKD41_07615 [Lutibacter sp. A64]